LQLQLNDNTKALIVNTSLDNQRVQNDKTPLAAQQAIYDFVKGKNS